MINLIGGYTPGFFFPFASVYTPVYPCVLDGSLSFLEMVWKILKDLNKTITAVNNNHTDIINLAAEIDRIEAALNQKLSYLEVNFNFLVLPVTADKTFEECVEAFDKGLVIGRGQMGRGELCFYAAIKKDDDSEIRFYAVTSHNTLAEIVYTADGITVTAHTNITTDGGTITGTLNVPEPTQNSNAATKKYVDDQDAATLNSAKNYADGEVDAALTYVSTHYVSNTGNAGSTYGTMAVTDRNFTNIPTSPDTITFNALLEKLGRWYVEIANKVSDVIVSESGGTYSANKTFVDVYQLVIEGQEVRCIYTTTDATRSKNVLRVENYGPTSILFKNNNYQLTWSSDDTISVTTI